MNAKIAQIEINGIPKYLEEIKKLSVAKPKLWFRGLRRITNALEPSIYRLPFDPSYEKQFLTKFKTRAIPFLESNPSDNYWEWLFLMQHHGVPTRLLDWSESALQALSLAIIFREDKHVGLDAAVWCLDPIKLNDYVKITPEEKLPIPNIIDNQPASQLYSSEYDIEYPIAITGPFNNARIAAQKGMFTLFPLKKVQSLEEKEKADEFLTLFKIKKEDVESIKEQLFLLGVTEASIFPDLDHLAKEIKREFKP